VAAFQNANKYLGGDFARVVAKNRQYREMAQQEAQAQMLFLGRVDVVVMDESIFLYYRQKLMAAHKVGPAQEVIGYDIFPPTPYKAAFIDPKIRNDFNKGIAAMRKDGRYEAIYHKYTEQYFQVRQ
jgi:polar amino acid transport system substrate-binding protein